MWFTRYMEERLNGGSMVDVCKKYGKKEGYSKVLGNWSYPNRWTERIEAYRDFLETARQKQRLKDIEEMNDRQSKFGKFFLQASIQPVMEKIQKGDAIILTPEQVARWAELGARMERTALGVPTEIHSEGELPEETRKRMEALYAEAISEDGEVLPDNIIKQSTEDDTSSDDE
jgi:hypothetical protein